ncbi:protein krueppel-like [Cylas formicarius]|uniref:protein krueppel-like n=1 Tax=Cylas formicarius TaxID=197179 RepID=UPI0029583535|nr:protein krueppel-like [Cylas formicarius]
MPKYECPLCFRRFKHEHHLEQHRRSKFRCAKTRMGCSLFLALPIFECLSCAKTYKHAHNLRRHIRYECNKNPQFRCDMCDKAYTQKSSLKHHYFMAHKKPLDHIVLPFRP